MGVADLGGATAGSTSADASTGLGRGFAPGRPSLVAYLMAGYPDRERSLEAMRAVASAGADVIELGVPYADPLADGPVIRDAAEAARAANEGGFGLAETIDLAREFVSAATPPVALMTYLNPIMRMGFGRAAEAMHSAGIEGVIVPDMPPDSATPWLAAARDLDTVFLAAPTSTPTRLSLVGARSQGFVYCVSTTGVTGERAELAPDLLGFVEAVKEATDLPVVVGFGVSTTGQAASIARFADGVVVGSALVRRQHDVPTLATFVEELASAVHGANAED